VTSVSSDVEYLRKQYKAAKSQANELIIQYNGKQFHDGDQLNKADAQVLPNVQINIQADSAKPYLTLVISLFSCST
jgi:hypothetical protein